MIRNMVLGVTFAIGLAFCAETVWADGGVLGLPNPFSKSTTSTKSKSSGNLWNPKKPTLIDQLNDGTKKAATATWDFVTLKWLWSQESNKTSTQTPKLYDRRKGSYSSKTSSSSSWWDNLWGKKEPTQPRTLSEWMSQKRPEP
ncbi:MAG TPA: hypothetical protein PK777_11070 [Thermoguttaceae bacterium]|nr:hypothetical protein [Thermoguttaceae bacterium]HPP53484.1 hypothetical protein [Thermoguttaceae bacterium]